MKIHLSESQVKKLISDYKTINEQSVGFNPETKTETVNFNSVWRAGYWKLTSNQILNLNNQMKVIQNFLVKNPQTKLSIQVEAGESKVTNADNEDGGKPVKPGHLSSRRGESLVNYLNTFFKKLENGGMSFTYTEIPKPKTIVGATPYVRGKDNPKNPKYKKMVNLQPVRFSGHPPSSFCAILHVFLHKIAFWTKSVQLYMSSGNPLCGAARQN